MANHGIGVFVLVFSKPMRCWIAGSATDVFIGDLRLVDELIGACLITCFIVVSLLIREHTDDWCYQDSGCRRPVHRRQL